MKRALAGSKTYRRARKLALDLVRLPGIGQGEFTPHYDETHTMIKSRTASSRTDRKGSHQVIDRILGFPLAPRVPQAYGFS